ncbi:DUF2946 family protein [Burkholderia sp. PU8-34]
MFAHRRRLHRAASIAIFAVLLNALAPAITSVQAALDRTAPAGRQLVADGRTPRSSASGPIAHGARCGAIDGSSHGHADHAPPDDTPHAHTSHAPSDGAAHDLHHGGDCPFCHVHAGSFGLPVLPPDSAAHVRFADPPATELERTTKHFLPRQHAFSRGPPASV